MIEFLRLRSLGVIENAEFEVGPGLTVLTGETGAGKTMVLTAVNLLLGSRVPTGIATGSDTAVQGEWRVPPDSQLASHLAAAEVHVSDGELLLTRTMPKEGRSRISANGLVITQNVLAQWADDMVAIHGQSEQILLRRASKQRDVIDRFAGPEHQLLQARYRHAYDRLIQLIEQWRIVNDSRDALEAEIAEITVGLEAISKVRPTEGEDVALSERAMLLTNIAVLQGAAAGALAQLDRDDDQVAALEQLHAARRSLESTSDLDERLRAASEQLASAAIIASDVAAELRSYLVDLEASPAELDSIQTRRADLAALCRQYGPEIKDVLAWEQRALSRLAELTESVDTSKVRAELDQARIEVGALGAELSASREDAAKRFIKLVSQELRGLAMPAAALEISLRTHPMADDLDAVPLPDGSTVAFGASGLDEVEFLLKPHAGAAAAPIAKAASGGELSRIMLALEVVLSDAASAPTMIFDEVDAGVGGKAAIEIGRRLQRLSHSTQVLVVTHLPQVAAFGDQHLSVTKSFDGTVTTSDVAALTGEDRVRELARMLAGQEDSEHAVAHARELLDLASSSR